MISEKKSVFEINKSPFNTTLNQPFHFNPSDLILLITS
jgi:hypothetical protein